MAIWCPRPRYWLITAFSSIGSIDTLIPAWPMVCCTDCEISVQGGALGAAILTVKPSL